MIQGWEATYKDDEAGLKEAQQYAHHVIEGLRTTFPNETDETLSIAARAVTQVLAKLSRLPMAYAGRSLEATMGAYPFAAAALIGVYALPEHDCEAEATSNQAADAPKAIESGDDMKDTGLYL